MKAVLPWKLMPSFCSVTSMWMTQIVTRSLTGLFCSGDLYVSAGIKQLTLVVIPWTWSRRPALFPYPEFQDSHNLPVVDLPHSAAHLPTLQLDQAFMGPRPLLFSGPWALVAVLFLQSLPHFSQALSSFSHSPWSTQPWIQPSFCLFCLPSRGLLRERHILMLIGYYKSEISNLRPQ